MKIILFLYSVCNALHVATSEQERINADFFEQIINKMESDVAELAREVERLYTTRCSALDVCKESNYDHCLSEYPSATCPAVVDLHIPACTSGDGNKACSGLYDFSVSTVRLPEEVTIGNKFNPVDPNIIETVCFSRQLDVWFQNKRTIDAPYWADVGVEPPSMYFGSHNGAFRIYPGRPSEDCRQYDPRLRPWYVAASSGPKNVVMVLDVSGSMQGLRLELMKEAAKRVISTLTVSDRVAIVAFESEARLIADRDQFLFTASAQNKEILIENIDKLEAGGNTNFYDAFNAAFNLLDSSIQEEFNVNCNTAILFLTDGELQGPDFITETDVIGLVQYRTFATKQLLNNRSILLFTYSISESENEVHRFPSQLACSVDDAIWSKITYDDEIVDSLSSYHQLFSIGLGDNKNIDFVAWVEPYKFATGDTWGTTASMPVYDRFSESEHPIFLGVVGIDFSLEAFNQALGNGQDNTEESIRRIVLASTARCPSLNLSLCTLEAYRRNAGNTTCTNGCNGYKTVKESQCSSGFYKHPSNLWANTANYGVPYTDRACCKSVSDSDQCFTSDSEIKVNSDVQSDDGGVSRKVVIFIVVGVIFGIVCCTLLKSCNTKKDQQQSKPPSTDPTPVEEPLPLQPPVKEPLPSALQLVYSGSYSGD